MKDFISAEDISFGYEADDGQMIPVLENLSISIREGEFVATARARAPWQSISMRCCCPAAVPVMWTA